MSFCLQWGSVAIQASEHVSSLRHGGPAFRAPRRACSPARLPGLMAPLGEAPVAGCVTTAFRLLFRIKKDQDMGPTLYDQDGDGLRVEVRSLESKDD